MWQNILDLILSLGAAFFTTLIVIGIYFLAKRLLDRQARGKTDTSLIRSIILFGILMTGIVAVILALPLDPDTKNKVTELMGYIISAVLALSSATFIGNGLAGIMLRAINSFKPGDFIHVNDHFGRVSERGLFHTEIQTENRDLTTIPNLYLTTHAVRVTQANGTFISGTCSLGYDVNRLEIEKALLDAAERADLKDAFVRVEELGDFSVVYKVFGMIPNIKTILSARSRLNASILDALHEAKIEIVSPNFMNQRQIGDTVFIPKKSKIKEDTSKSDSPEMLIFDKAEGAGTIEKRKEQLVVIENRILEQQENLRTCTEEEKLAIQEKIERLQNLKPQIEEKLAALVEKQKK